jgi:hypothetical protein
VTFVERPHALHVVSLVPGANFDVEVSLDAEGHLVAPAHAPFELRDGQVVLRDRVLAPTERLVETGQLYPHDDHFHLTHRWDNEDWRALYRVREDASDVPAATKQVAAFALATLLDYRIPGKTEEATAHGLQRMTEAASRARRAVEARSPAKQTMAMVLHDFEILRGGLALAIEGKLFKAADGVRFSYCGDHFHVEDAGGVWAHPISLDAVDPGEFEMPPSMFFEVQGDAVVARTGEVAWRDLIRDGAIKLVGDRWYVTERYAYPAFAQLQRVSADLTVPSPVRELARRGVIDLLKVPLEVESDEVFRSALAGVEARIEARWRRVEGMLPAAAKR